MALAQVEAGYEVSIIAQDAAKQPYMREGVKIIPIGVFGRLSFRRILSIWSISRKAKALKADVYQIHAVELLALGKQLKKQLPKAKIVWDMHEDYVANILYADYYSDGSRKQLAARVANLQQDFCKWGDGLVLAEECFHSVLDFPAERTAIVRNKFQLPTSAIAAENTQMAMPMMVCTGTIAEDWGVFRAIELWKALNKRQKVALVIAGHAQDGTILAKIEEAVAASGLGKQFLLLGGKEYLPFETIVQWIRSSTFGIALYDPKQNIKDRIPTKFYEFMAQNKPLVFSKNPAWDALNARLNFGLSVDWPLEDRDLDAIEAKLLHQDAIQSWEKIPKEEWSWEAEKAGMLDLLSKI